MEIDMVVVKYSCLLSQSEHIYQWQINLDIILLNVCPILNIECGVSQVTFTLHGQLTLILMTSSTLPNTQTSGGHCLQVAHARNQ